MEKFLKKGLIICLVIVGFFIISDSKIYGAYYKCSQVPGLESIDSKYDNECNILGQHVKSGNIQIKAPNGGSIKTDGKTLDMEGTWDVLDINIQSVISDLQTGPQGIIAYNTPYVKIVSKDPLRFKVYYYASNERVEKCKTGETPKWVDNPPAGNLKGWYCDDGLPKEEEVPPDEGGSDHGSDFPANQITIPPGQMCPAKLSKVTIGDGVAYNCPATLGEDSCPCGYANHYRGQAGVSKEYGTPIFRCYVTKEDANNAISATDAATDGTTAGAPNGSATNMGSAGNFADFWKNAFEFFNPATGDTSDPAVSAIMNTIIGILRPVGITLLFILIILQGTKLMLTNSSEKKSEIKQSLVSILVAGILILSGVELFNVFKGVIEVGNDLNTTFTGILGILVQVIQVVAFAAIIFTGLRYMTATSAEKAKLKSSLIILIIGAILVFGAPFVFSIIETISNMLIKS